MTAAAFRKYQTYLYDSKGKPVAVQLDLRNKVLKGLFDELMEDYEDTLIAMERDNEDTISHEEVKKRVLAAQSIS